MEIDKYTGHRIKHLSKGNAVKIGIVSCLSWHPKYIILDEPTSGLDIGTRNEVYRVLSRFKQDDTTVIFSTHISEDIDIMADHIILLKDGLISMNVNKSELIENHPAESIASVISAIIEQGG